MFLKFHTIWAESYISAGLFKKWKSEVFLQRANRVAETRLGNV